MKETLKRLQYVVNLHTKGDFKIGGYHADNEFKKIESDMIPYTLHTQTSGEHEPMAERNIMTLKDRDRSTVKPVPYRKMPLLMIDLISKQAQSTLNDFPSKKWISTTLSARNIVEGRPNLDYNTMYIKLVSYV